MEPITSRDEFFKAAATSPVREVATPSGMKTFVRSLSEAERSSYEAIGLHDDGTIDIDECVLGRARLVTLCVCTKDGARLLQDGDLERVQSMNAADMNAICDEARKLNGFTKEDKEALEKNSRSRRAAD